MKRLWRIRTERVIAFAGRYAEEGENPVVVVPTMMQGVHPGVLGNLPLIVFFAVLALTRSLLAAIAADLVVLGVVLLVVHARALVLTETRVMLLRCNPILLRPRGLEVILPRSDVRVSMLRFGQMWTRMSLQVPEGDRPFWVHRYFRRATRDLYAALGPAAVDPAGATAEALPPPIL